MLSRVPLAIKILSWIVVGCGTKKLISTAPKDAQVEQDPIFSACQPYATTTTCLFKRIGGVFKTMFTKHGSLSLWGGLKFMQSHKSSARVEHSFIVATRRR
jgi:hypothetical protein